MSHTTKEGFNYAFDAKECSNCQGNCCIGESGYIWISKPEVFALADFLNMPFESLGMNYLRKVGYRYSIQEREIAPNNHACIFFDLENKQCSIYQVRPEQCRTFPFWEHFKNKEQEVYEECPAVKPL